MYINIPEVLHINLAEYACRRIMIQSDFAILHASDLFLKLNIQCSIHYI